MVDVGGAISLGGGGGGGGTVSDVTSSDSSITVTTPTGPTVGLILPAVGTAGTSGDNANYPIVTTDAKGRVSGVTLQPLASTPAITNVTWTLVRRSATATAGQTECTIFNGSTAGQTISLPTTGQSYRIINAASVPVSIVSAVHSMFIENVLYAATSPYVVPVGMGITFTYDATGIWYAVSWDPLGASTVVGPDTYNSPAVVGSSLLYARADHDHGLPAAPSSALSYQQSFITAAVNLTVANTVYNVTSLTLPAGTWWINAQILTFINNTSQTQVASGIGPNSASFTGAYSSGVTIGTATTADGNTVTFSAVVVLAASTTVYLFAEATSTSCVVESSSPPAINTTGLIAVKIA